MRGRWWVNIIYMFCCSRFQRCLATDSYPFILLYVPSHPGSRGAHASSINPFSSQPVAVRAHRNPSRNVVSILYMSLPSRCIFTVPYHTIPYRAMPYHTIDGSPTPIDFHHRSFLCCRNSPSHSHPSKTKSPQKPPKSGPYIYHPIVNISPLVIFSPMKEKSSGKNAAIRVTSIY